MLLLAVACARLLVFSVACDACGSRFSRASRSSIARFLILGVFLEPLVFSKNATPSIRKPCFWRSGGSQNGAKMAPKMLQKSSSGAGGLRESLRERFGRLLEAQEAPQRLPRGSPERPRRAPGAPQEAQREPQEVQNEPQEGPNDPQEGQNEPQEGQSELREVPGGFRERFGLDFSKNATPSTRKPCFLRSGGSQNEAKMLQFRRCVRTPRCFETCNTLAQWPAWGRSPTGDPATEPLRLKRGP